MLPIRKFVAPELIFGKGAIDLLPQYIMNYGASRVFFVTDPGVIAAGWLDRATALLANKGIDFDVYSDLHSNPRESEVMEGARRYAESGCDVIVALGGGSPMDSAKGIGVVSTNKRHILEFEGVDKVDIPGPPLICIPTTSGSAADVSQFAIINNTTERVKVAVISKSMVPDLALIDPEVTSTMDRYLTACTAMDTLVHAIEAYVSLASSPLTDVNALAAINLVHEYLPSLLADLNNKTAREKIMLACLQAGLAFSNASLGAVHAMAHSLGGYFDFAHGECNALLLEHVIAYNYESAPSRFDQIGSIFSAEIDALSAEAKPKAVVDAIKRFKNDTGLHDTISQKGVAHKDIHELAVKAVNDPCMLTNPRRPTLKDIEALYEAAL